MPSGSRPETGLRFGSEVYTWFMKEEGRAHANRLGHMIEIIARAGFRGVQPIFSWMGDLSDASRLADCLKAHDLALAALSVTLEWNHKQETVGERRAADSAIDLLRHFPGAIFCAVQKPVGRFDVIERRHRLLANIHSAARRAAEYGIPSSFHPNSPSSSITRTREDYDVLLSGLDRSLIGWTPDVGHIINAGMDPLTLMREYGELINHVHFKDWDGQPEFALMGEGKVDFVSITAWLRGRGYSGWIVCEDEAPAAVDDPDGVMLHDGKWISEYLTPQLLRSNEPCLK